LNTLPEELELIPQNSGIISLDWYDFPPWKLSDTIPNTVEPFAGSLKKLRLLSRFPLFSELVSLLNHFSNLERFQMSANLRPPFRSNLADLIGMAGVRIQALKELMIVANIEYWDNVGALLSIFQQCSIEHIVLHVHNSVGAQRLVQSALQLLLLIWETVLAWKS